MSKKLQIYSMKWTIKDLNNLNKSLTIFFEFILFDIFYYKENLVHSSLKELIKAN